MSLFLKLIIAFLALTGLVFLLGEFSEVEFGQGNYWDHRGVLFLIFVSIFPRLTLLFSSVAFGGVFWWLGWIFAPRFLVAILATLSYWNQNPILVILSWLIAISGESGEKGVVVRRSYRPRAHRPILNPDVIDVTPNSSSNKTRE